MLIYANWVWMLEGWQFPKQAFVSLYESRRIYVSVERLFIVPHLPPCLCSLPSLASNLLADFRPSIGKRKRRTVRTKRRSRQDGLPTHQLPRAPPREISLRKAPLLGPGPRRVWVGTKSGDYQMTWSCSCPTFRGIVG